ncbi:MAG TPA: TolC family protein, partial [Candidatus Wujingus californicus]
MVLIIILLISISFISHDVIAAEGKNENISQKQTNKKTVTIVKNDNNATLDIKWLINEAIEQNPEIIAAQKRLNAAKAKISQAKSLDDPTIRVGSYDMSNNPVNVNGQTEMLQQRYGVSQKIPFPGKLRLRNEVAIEEANMIERDSQSKIQEITALVKSAYYELFYINSAIDITEENRDLLRKFTKIAETKYSVGKTTQRDVLAAQVELSTLANSLIVLNKEMESIIARLNSLLDRPTHASLGKPRPFKKNTLTLTIKELEDLAIKNRPELRKFDHAVKKEEATLRLSKKD